MEAQFVEMLLLKKARSVTAELLRCDMLLYKISQLMQHWLLS